LLVAGFLLVAMPLAGALLYSAWRTEQLAAQSRSAVFDAALAARVSRSLVNRVGALERLALQRTVFRDAALKADFERARAGFLRVVRELDRLPLETGQREAIHRMSAREQALRALFAALPPGAPPEAGAVRKTVDALAEEAHQVLAISDRVADREVERLRASAEDTHRRLVALLLAGIAVALAAALALARFIARPVADLDAAIRQLGKADFGRPIRVSGPEDLRGLGERLDWLRLRLVELETQKSRFLRHISHDLKTPLAALREGTALLGDEVAGPLAPPQRQVVAILRDNSGKLQQMIEELLEYQRTLHAAAELELGNVRLDVVLRQSLEAHRLAANAKAQRIELDAGPIGLRADALKIRSIVDNLLGNAIKFTPPGGTVRLLARDRGASATIETMDSGSGVPAEEREAIFEPFYRGRAASRGRPDGTGLGLAIAREFAEAHGGSIEVVPQARGGHFRVTLPKLPVVGLAVAA